MDALTEHDRDLGDGRIWRAHHGRVEGTDQIDGRVTVVSSGARVELDIHTAEDLHCEGAAAAAWDSGGVYVTFDGSDDDRGPDALAVPGDVLTHDLVSEALRRWAAVNPTA
jgi:hypothetical protein